MTEEAQLWIGTQQFALEAFTLVTLGLDIGSTTSHLLLARVLFRRQGARLSGEYKIAGRSLLYESPIVLTPYADDGSIDAERLGNSIEGFLRQAGGPQIDSGIVVITGEALRRHNSEAISKTLARQIGGFTCVSAGPRHEAMLAAYGSGSVQRSLETGSTVVNVDIGGGTTKFSVVRSGRIEETMALGVGGRLMAFDEDDVSRLEPAASPFLKMAGEDARLGQPLPVSARNRVADAMAGVIASALRTGHEATYDRCLLITNPVRLPHPSEVDAYVFSGGVSEYLYGRTSLEHHDLGAALAHALQNLLEECGVWEKVVTPTEYIRATAIGAGEYTIQVSGMTSYISEGAALPRFGLQTIALASNPADRSALPAELQRWLRLYERDALDADIAVAVSFPRPPSYADLVWTGRTLVDAAGSTEQLYVLVEQDVARSLGQIMCDELHWPGELVVIDGIAVHDLDYVDIGGVIPGTDSLAVTVKSLLFASLDEPRNSYEQVERQEVTQDVSG